MAVIGVRDQIRKQARNFAWLIAIVIAGVVVGGYIVGHQRIAFPSWVPVVGRDTYTLKAEFQTAQAVAPGQGQTVTVAGVQVGQIDRVDLVGGRALVTMSIERSSGVRVHRDARLLLRPKTGLKDMTVTMDPGSPSSPVLPDGATLPISQTQPDINLDEFLAGLDADSRDYLRLLVNGAGTGIGGNGRQLAAVFKRFDPTARNLRRITALLVSRHAHISRAIHDFSLLAGALGERDRQLAGFVQSSNAVLSTFAQEDGSLRESLALLPDALRRTGAGLAKVTPFARTAGAALARLQPAADSLAAGLAASRPFLRSTTPVIQNELRPFARVATPTFATLRPAAAGLVPTTRDLTTTFSVFERFLNELAFAPAGKPGYLYYLAWAGHNFDSIFSFGDANGPMGRGQVLVNCDAQAVLESAAKVNKTIGLLVALLNPPDASRCARTAG
ncbi:MAG TPA: MlaD family protein [Solirubrobacteraceae bacterium]|nr:MlaD family protein [Solirubrobacteraceae bacterium]